MSGYVFVRYGSYSQEAIIEVANLIGWPNVVSTSLVLTNCMIWHLLSHRGLCVAAALIMKLSSDMTVYFFAINTNVKAKCDIVIKNLDFLRNLNSTH